MRNHREESLVFNGLAAPRHQERAQAVEAIRAGVRRSGRLKFRRLDKLFHLLSQTLQDSNWNVRRDTIALLAEIVPKSAPELEKYVVGVVRTRTLLDVAADTLGGYEYEDGFFLAMSCWLSVSSHSALLSGVPLAVYPEMKTRSVCVCVCVCVCVVCLHDCLRAMCDGCVVAWTVSYAGSQPRGQQSCD